MKENTTTAQLEKARAELEQYKSWIEPLYNRIDRAVSEVKGQMEVNVQLIVAHDNYVHYRKWAESELDLAHGVIKRQRLEIEQFNLNAGKSPFFAGVYGHVSTENQQQLNGFVDGGVHYKPVLRNMYKQPTPSDMVETRLFQRAHELCDVEPGMRLNIIGKEFPYISLLKAELEEKKKNGTALPAARQLNQLPQQPQQPLVNVATPGWHPLLFKKMPEARSPPTIQAGPTMTAKPGAGIA